MKSLISLHSGIEIDLINPKPEMIKIEDIAKGLAYKGHFMGQTDRFFSIAEHSILVSILTDDLEGLLHDSAEAYIGDMPTPLKKHFPKFKEIEINLLIAIEHSIGLDPGFYESKLIKCIDTTILAIEWNTFYKFKENPFIKDEYIKDLYNKYKNDLHINYYTPEESYRLFIERFYNLKSNI